MKNIKITLTICFLTYLFIGFQFPSLAFGQQTDNQKLESVRSLVEQYYIDPVSAELLQNGNIETILKGLDPYSEYMTREDFEQFLNALDPQFSGIGVQVEKVEEGILIINVFPDSPAEKVGMRSGDIITAVNDESIVSMSIEAAVSLITGETGTSVKLKIVRLKTNETLTISVVRQPIVVPIVTYERLGGNIGYIRINSFGAQTITQLNKALVELGNVNGYILDLRNNGGGYFETAREVLGFFSKVDIAVKMDFKEQKKLVYSKIKQNNSFQQSVALLVNNRSASASEIVAGALKDYEAATLYGQTTFGKGTMQSFYYVDPFNSSQSDLLKLTIGRFFTPYGNIIDQVGVSPNVVTEEGKELFQAHKGFLSSIFKKYSSLTKLVDVTNDTSFLVTFTDPVDWSTVTESSFELIELGGQSYSFTYKPISEKQLVVTPSEKLQNKKDYYFYIHPGLKGLKGEVLKKGYHIPVNTIEIEK